MSQEQKLNSGALFKNNKGDKANRPDYKGSFTDSTGQELWLSAWVKKDKNGNSYISLSAQPKEKKQPSHTPKKEYAESDKDELPF